MSVTQAVTSTVKAHKLATATAATTPTMLIGEVIDLIPNDIAKLGVLISIALSLVIIYVQLQNAKKTRVETRLLEAEERKLNDE